MIQQSRQRFNQGFRQIVDRGPDLLDAVVGKFFSRLAHGKQVNRETVFFKQTNFIGDESFGNPGVALQDHPQNRAPGFAHILLHLNLRRRFCMVSMPVNRNRDMALW